MGVSSQMTVRNGADLTVSKHDALTPAAIAGGEVLPRVSVEGTLTLSQPTTRFGSVSIEGADSAIEVNGGSNDFVGVTSFDDIFLSEVAVSVPNDVSFGVVQADFGAGLTVGGELTWTDDLFLTDSTITATKFVADAAGAGTVSAVGTDSRLVGDVELLAEVYIGSSDAPGDTVLVVDGDLEMGSATEIFAGINDDGTSRLDVTGKVDLAGEIRVFVGDVLAAGRQVPVFTWAGTSTGSIATTLTGNKVTPDTTIEQRDGAVVVSQGGGALAFEQVTALGVTLGLDDAAVALAWPSSPGAVGYDVSVDGDVVATVADTTYVAAAKIDTSSTFTVAAVDAGGVRTALGALDLRIPAPGQCTTTWSGAVDDDWGTPLNWVPVVTAPSVPPTPSVPLVAQQVCIDVATNLPVIVDDIDVDLLAVTSQLAPSDGRIVDISSSTFDAGGVLSVPTVRIDDSFLVAVDVNSDLIEMSSTTVNADSVGARRIEHGDSPATSKQSEIVAALDADIVDIDAGTRLVIRQLDDPAATALVVRGSVQIDTPITGLRGLNLLGSAASITIDDGPANTLTGVASIDTLTLEAIDDFSVSGNLSIGALSIEDSALLASDGLTIVRSLDAANGNEVRATNITFGSAALVRTVVRPPSQFTVIGATQNMALAGNLEIDVRAELTAPGLPVLEWATATGTIGTTLTGPFAAGAEVVRNATGLRVQPIPDAVEDLVATGISIDGPGRTAAVSLAWPSTPGAVRYEVFVGASTTASATSSTTTATLAASPASAGSYRVVAIDDKGDDTIVGTIALFVPGPGVCTVTWTGAIDDHWENANNWAPVVDAPATLPAVSAPTSGAEVCIDVTSNLPVDATDVEVGLASVTSRLDPAVGLALDIDSSTLEVAGAVTVPGLRIDDSFLDVGTVDADRLVVSSSTVLATDVRAARIEHVDLDSPTTQSDIVAIVDAGVIDVADKTTLDITELADSKGTTFVIRGSASVAEPFTELAGLNLTARDASITLGSEPRERARRRHEDRHAEPGGDRRALGPEQPHRGCVVDRGLRSPRRRPPDRRALDRCRQRQRGERGRHRVRERRAGAHRGAPGEPVHGDQGHEQHDAGRRSRGGPARRAHPGHRPGRSSRGVR